MRRRQVPKRASESPERILDSQEQDQVVNELREEAERAILWLYVLGGSMALFLVLIYLGVYLNGTRKQSAFAFTVNALGLAVCSTAFLRIRETQAPLILLSVGGCSALITLLVDNAGVRENRIDLALVPFLPAIAFCITGAAVNYEQMMRRDLVALEKHKYTVQGA